MALPTYSTGIVSVPAGGNTITGVGTVWSGVNVMPGDIILIAGGGQLALISDVVDTTHLKTPFWFGTGVTNAGYTIYQCSPLRFDGAQVAQDLQTLVAALNTTGFIIFVPNGATEPDKSLGDDGQYAYQMTTNTWWKKAGGLWSTSGAPNGNASVIGNNSFAGTQTITNATDATDATHGGALTVAGGLAVAKKLFVGGTATFSGVLDVNSAADAVLGGTNSGSINTAGGLYVAKTLAVAGSISTGQVVPQFAGAYISARGPGTNIEFAHSNQAGYGSSLGCNQSSGQPWLLFCGSAGTNPNTFRTYGIRGSLLRSDMGGGFIFAALANSSGDNQSETQTASLSALGQFSPVSLSSVGSTLPIATTLVATNKGHQFGVNGGTAYTGALANSDPNILFYNISSTNWAGIGADTGGNVWIRTGISGTPAAAFAVTATRAVVIPALGAGTLSTNSSGIISSSSDERLKEILGGFDRGLDEVRRLRPILYKWNDKSGLADDVTYAGFGAGAVRKVIPEAIGRDGRGYLSLNDRPIIAALVNAVVELDGRLTKLAA